MFYDRLLGLVLDRWQEKYTTKRTNILNHARNVGITQSLQYIANRWGRIYATFGQYVIVAMIQPQQIHYTALKIRGEELTIIIAGMR